eukprot:355343-Chlamydomonas_euryale.AAC.7
MQHFAGFWVWVQQPRLNARANGRACAWGGRPAARLPPRTWRNPVRCAAAANLLRRQGCRVARRRPRRPRRSLTAAASVAARALPRRAFPPCRQPRRPRPAARESDRPTRPRRARATATPGRREVEPAAFVCEPSAPRGPYHAIKKQSGEGWPWDTHAMLQRELSE